MVKVLRSFVNKQGVRVWFFKEIKGAEEATLRDVPWTIWQGAQAFFREFTNPVQAILSGKESWKQFGEIYDQRIKRLASRKPIKLKIPKLGKVLKWL